LGRALTLAVKGWVDRGFKVLAPCNARTPGAEVGMFNEPSLMYPTKSGCAYKTAALEILQICISEDKTAHRLNKVAASPKSEDVYATLPRLKLYAMIPAAEELKID
jgi:hypothetical protein